MQKRLCGREQEFGIRLSPAPSFAKQGTGDVDHFFRTVSESILRELSKKYEAIGISEMGDYDSPNDFVPTVDDFWLANGMRMYIDQGILETATPEHLPCTLDSVLYERASEEMLNVGIASFLKKNPRYKLVSLYKNNIAYDVGNMTAYENTYGSHQNYSCNQKSIRRISVLLRSFLPAALPLTGSGHILYSKDGAKFCFSQRADHIDIVTGLGTTSERSLINTRGFSGSDTLMPKNGLARLHLISCDATRCEFQTWLVEGILHLVLRLAEEGWELPESARLSNPIGNLKEFNKGANVDYLLQMTSGRQIRVLNYLKLFLKGAGQLKSLSSGEKECLEKWEVVLDLLKDSESAGLVGKLDWATKLYLLKNQMKKHKFDLNDGRAIGINMEYHNISNDPNQSWFARLQESGYITRLSTDAMVERAIHNAPLTRAAARGKFIRNCLKARGWRSRIGGVSWGGAFWNGIPVVFGRKGDPFSTELGKP